MKTNELTVVLGGVCMVALSVLVAVGLGAAASAAEIPVIGTNTQGCRDAMTDGNITWTMAKYYPARQTFCGDWIVTPRADDSNAPIVVSVSPETVFDGNDPTTLRHGSVVNPMPSTYSSYDGRVTLLDANALATFPLTLDPNGASLVSTESRAEGDDFNAATGHRGYVSEASVLTCLATMPANVGQCLRPPYAGSDPNMKTVYSVASLDVNSLPAYASVSGTPTLANYTSPYAIDGNPAHGYIDWRRTWLDEVIDFTSQEIHPFYAMEDYGRDICRHVGDALLLLCIGDNGDRTTLAAYVCQRGVDYWGILQAGGAYPANGAHGPGRAPIVVAAGSMLGDPNMVAAVATIAGADPNAIHEVGQTFYIAQADVDRLLDCEVDLTVTSADANSVTGTVSRTLDGYALVAHGTCEVTAGTGLGQVRPILSTTGQTYGVDIEAGNPITLVVADWSEPLDPNDSVVSILGYQVADIGTAEWGIVHYTGTRDNPGWSAAYRLSNGYVWVGEALAMELMGLDDDWQAPAFFAYVQRHFATTDTGGAWPDPGNHVLSAFQGAFYTAHHTPIP